MGFYLKHSVRAHLRAQGWRLPNKVETFAQVRTSVTAEVMRVMHMKHASTINRGACFIWAWLCSLYNPGIRLVSTEGHAVVSFGQQCFDAEGQARLTERAYLQDTVEFSAYWTGHGKYRSTFEPIARPLLPGSDKPRFRALRGEGEPHGEEFRF